MNTIPFIMAFRKCLFELGNDKMLLSLPYTALTSIDCSKNHNTGVKSKGGGS